MVPDEELMTFVIDSQKEGPSRKFPLISQKPAERPLVVRLTLNKTVVVIASELNKLLGPIGRLKEFFSQPEGDGLIVRTVQYQQWCLQLSNMSEAVKAVTQHDNLREYRH